MKSKSFKQTAQIAARKASKALLHYFDKKAKIKIKSNKSLVGEADLKANSLIIETIKKYYPQHSILSEETGFEDNKSDYKWVIDPLDGTHNYLHGIPFFGTSIALEFKNEVILGLLHFPILGFTAIAEKGKGAFLNGKRINVSNRQGVDHSLILFEFSYANRKEKISFLENIMHKTVDVRNFGCAVYHLLLVACGRSDAYVILTTNEWDVAAGFLIAEEAGAKITDIKGNKWNFKERRYVISNGNIHKDILKFIVTHKVFR